MHALYFRCYMKKADILYKIALQFICEHLLRTYFTAVSLGVLSMPALNDVYMVTPKTAPAVAGKM